MESAVYLSFTYVDAESIGRHFVNAGIKVFPFNELELAKKWTNYSE